MLCMVIHDQKLLWLVKNLMPVQTGNFSFQEDTRSIVHNLKSFNSPLKCIF